MAHRQGFSAQKLFFADSTGDRPVVSRSLMSSSAGLKIPLLLHSRTLLCVAVENMV